MTRTFNIQSLVAMLDEDYLSLKEIAASFGYSKQYVHRFLQRHGVSVPKLPKHGFTDYRCRQRDQLLSIVKDSCTVEEVGRKLEIPANSVRVWMKHHSISTNELKPYKFSAHHAWRGGVFKYKGYVYMHKDIGGKKSYSNFNPSFKERYVKEHRAMVENNLLNTPLPEGFVVHHIDGDTMNNEPENLQILTMSQHAYYHNLKRKIVAKKKIEELNSIAEKWSEANIALLKLRT